MRRVPLVLAYLTALLLPGCTHTDIPEKEYTEKKVAIWFEGNPERTYPWVSFSAYTENHEDLYAIQGNDTTIDLGGTFGILRGGIHAPGPVVLYASSRTMGWIHLGVTYRKRMASPSADDELRVRIKGYVNDVLRLDTTHTMRAFRIEEKPKASEYMYDIHF